MHKKAMEAQVVLLMRESASKVSSKSHAAKRPRNDGMPEKKKKEKQHHIAAREKQAERQAKEAERLEREEAREIEKAREKVLTCAS